MLGIKSPLPRWSIRCKTARGATISISTSTVQRFSLATTPGDRCAPYLLAGGGHQGRSQNLAGITDPAIDALIDTIITAHSRTELTIACTRPRSRGPRRTLLGAALVQGTIPDRLLGRVRPPGQQAALCPASALPKPGGMIATKAAKLGLNRTQAHGRLYRSTRPCMIPTDLSWRAFDPFCCHRAGWHHDSHSPPLLVRARHRAGAVRAGRHRSSESSPSSPGRDTSATSRISGAGRRFRHQQQPAGRSRPSARNIAARRASIRTSSRSLEKQFELRQAAPERFLLMVWNFARFDFGKSYFRDVSVIAARSRRSCRSRCRSASG